MVKSSVILFVASLSALAFCQSGEISLGEAVPIDHRVTQVDWQPGGRALIYQREQEKGIGLGVFEPGKFEGKVVLNLEKEDTIENTWLADSNSALLVVRGPAVGAKTKSTNVRIYLIEGDNQTSKQLFAQIYDDKALPTIDVDVSPGLKHAIVTFRTAEGNFHKVLTQGGGNFTDAPDLDRADKAGMSGPSWSLDGTAIYGAASSYGNSGANDKAELYRRVLAEKVAYDQEVSKATLDKAADRLAAVATIAEDTNLKLKLSEAKYTRLAFRRYHPSPNVGSDVFELMPANPILRPVRFRGPWEYPKKTTTVVVPKTQSIVLKYDQSNAQDNSVWLARSNDKGAPATLVAVHVTDTWLASAKNGVAYTIDGALFYRGVK